MKFWGSYKWAILSLKEVCMHHWDIFESGRDDNNYLKGIGKYIGTIRKNQQKYVFEN